MKHRDRESRGRLRVSIGILIIAFTLQLSVPANAARADGPLKLVVANSMEYEAAIVLSAKRGATETAEGWLRNCVPFGHEYSLDPAGAEYVTDLAENLCGEPAFALIDAPANADAVCVIRFQTVSERASFALPPIGSVTSEQSSTVGPLVNHGDIHSFVTTFPKAETPMRAKIFGGIHLFVPHSERFTVAPPVSQYAIQATGIYFVTVEIEACTFAPCPVYEPVYGFASDGDSLGGTFRAFPFGTTP